MEKDRSGQWEQSKQGAIEELEKLIKFEEQHNLLEQVIAVTGGKQFTARDMLTAIEEEDEYGKQLIQMYQMRQKGISGILNKLMQYSHTNGSSKESNESTNSSAQDEKNASSTDPNLLLIRPNKDSSPLNTYVTRFSYPASDKLLAAKGPNSWVSWNITDLYGDLANQNNVDWHLRNGNIDFVLHYGHGLHDAILGQNEQPVIDTSNDDLLKGKALSTVSCSSANAFVGLGQDAVKKGAKAYLGYGLPFWEPSPDQTDLINIFTKAVNAPNIALLNGEKYQDAYDEGMENYLLGFPQLVVMEIAAALAGDRVQYGIISWAICFLLWDMNCFTLLGDGTVSFMT